MAEKILSPGVFTNEIDQSFLPATAGPIGAAIVGPTVKGPILQPTIVSSYAEYVSIFGELIESGSDKFQYLTSHTAKEYLRQGGPATIVRVADASLTKASATIAASGSVGSLPSVFKLEALGHGTIFNNSGSHDSNGRISPRVDAADNHFFTSGSYGGRSDNFRFEISQRNLSKGTFTLLIRQGNDETDKKKVLETHSNLSLDPESPDYILKRIGNETTSIAVEDSQAFIQTTGEYPVRSKYVRIKSLFIKTPNYLKEDGTIDSVAYGDGDAKIPSLGSGSYGGSFSGGQFGTQNAVHPFNFYLETDSGTNSQGVNINGVADGSSAYPVQPSAVGGGYATAINLLKNKDEYDIDMLLIPGIIDQNGAGSISIVKDAIQMCEDRGDCFLVYDPSWKTDTVATVKTAVETRNSSYAAAYYPWVQILADDVTMNRRYVPPSVVIGGVYHFNDTVGQPWFAPAGLNRGGIDTAIQAYRKLTQGNRDDLYESNVNPIATFPGQGVTVFGQKTTQKKASALDRVNVRRLLINLKKFVANSSRGLVFEQNTTDLRNQFLNTVNPYMEQVQANQGLNAFRVVMDDSNNTPETIDRNQLIGQIFLQPTRTAEFIVLDFVVQPTGAAFPE